MDDVATIPNQLNETRNMCRITLYFQHFKIQLHTVNIFGKYLSSDDQGAMCFLGSVIAIKSHRCFLPDIGRSGMGFLIETTDDRCISKPIF